MQHRKASASLVNCDLVDKEMWWRAPLPPVLAAAICICSEVPGILEASHKIKAGVGSHICKPKSSNAPLILLARARNGSIIQEPWQLRRAMILTRSTATRAHYKNLHCKSSQIDQRHKRLLRRDMPCANRWS
jgi:hypothetical protein